MSSLTAVGERGRLARMSSEGAPASQDYEPPTPETRHSKAEILSVERQGRKPVRLITAGTTDVAICKIRVRLFAAMFNEELT
jgi:hypothetical protein